MDKKVVNFKEVALTLKQPFTRSILADVDNYRAYLSRFEGTYVYHKHPKDELYMVLEGEIFIDFPDGTSVQLKEGDIWVAKAHQVHRSRSEKGSLVLMFKAKGLPSEIINREEL
ncbi:MAG TPA: cupin domain-containing protein [Chloroflexi bacterium]|nr:cupin domain-containing protein [Chloroflexota bacterium]